MTPAPDIRHARQGRAGFVFDAACLPAVDADLFDPDNPALRAQAVGQGGRQAAWFVHGSFGAAVLRHYRRGGLMARLNADRYLWLGLRACRAWAEFHLLADMHALGLAVPRPLAAAWWRQGLGYRAALLTARIDGACALAGLATGPVDAALAQRVAQAILAMHAAGFWHADLNAYNILCDAQAQVWLIDFDKGRRRRPAASWRRANLARLRRSLVKLAGDQGDLWWKGINAAYWQAQGRARPGKNT